MSQINQLHQFVIGAYQGDAIFNQAAILQQWLQDREWQSKIYAENIQPKLVKQVEAYQSYQPQMAGEVVILHYSIGTPLLQYLLELDIRFVLVYHNITPPRFMTGLNTPHQQFLQLGLDTLPRFVQRTILALADSEYNRQDLEQAGFTNSKVLPVPFNESDYNQPADQKVLNRYKDDFVNLLFVGRIVPNKRLEDVIKVFYYYRQINPQARLFLVGMPLSSFSPYQAWLYDLIKYLGLTDVRLTGYVTLPQLLAYYQLADVYVSMSEHEGYGVPLIESMYFDIPVLAYQATAVPYTLGQSGLQVSCKDYPLIAELIDQLITHPTLREAIISQQRQRLSEMSMERIKDKFDGYIDEIIIKFERFGEKMNKEEIQARANEIQWFHNYELVPGVMTNGLGLLQETERAEYFQIPQDLSGKRVLDIGCADGYFTFLAESRGASVVSIDAWPHQGFALAHEVRGSKAEFHQIDLYDLTPDTFGMFDVVFFMGVYYHLKNPGLALERIASVTREMAIIESHIMNLPGYETESISRFYEHDGLAPGDPTNWWVPNVPCLVQTVRAAGFPQVKFIGRYLENNRGIVHAFKGPRTAERMLTEDFVCLIHTPMPNIAVKGTVQVGGVAFSKLDPQNGVDCITIYLDNLDDPAAELGQAEHGKWHPEIVPRVGKQYGSIGFEFSWDASNVPDGEHTLYVLVEGKAGWHYSRQPIIVGEATHQNNGLRSNEFAGVNAQSEAIPASMLAKLLRLSQVGEDISVSFPGQAQWPFANQVRRAFHNLVIYYVNILAQKQNRFNQLILALLNQLVAAEEKTRPEIETLQKEITSLRDEIKALKNNIKTMKESVT